MKKLVEYDWPGNVREMENTLERIVLINDKPIIEREEIESILEENKAPNNDSKSSNVAEADKDKESSTSINKNSEKNNIDIDDISFDKEKPMTLKELERIAILAGLERTNWNMSTTATQLELAE